jgi:hypothetical protein
VERSSKSARIDKIFVSASVAAASKEHLYMFFFANPTVALSLIEDPHLVASYGALGITLPSRKTLSGTILDRVHGELFIQVLVQSFASSTKAASPLQPGELDPFGVKDLP